MEQYLSEPRSLQRLVRDYDVLAKRGMDFAGLPVQGLPYRMSLIPYFLASAGESHGFFQLDCKLAFHGTQDRDGLPHLVGSDSGSGLHARIGNAMFEHEINHISRESGIEYFFRDRVFFEADDNEAAVSLHSANTDFFAGHDYGDIRRIGSVINVGKEGFFRPFLGRNALSYDPKKFSLTPTQYELVITPKFEVPVYKFTETMHEVIRITNQVLARMKRPRPVIERLAEPAA